MKKQTNFLMQDEQGNIMVLFAVSMLVIIGMLGVVIDTGFVYKEKSDLKKAATTAALSGAQELTNTEPTRVENVVNTILTSYQEQTSLQELQIEMEQQVRVSLRKKVPLSFARIFGFDSITVAESATARIFPIGAMKGVAPLGINESTQVNYGEITTLKVGPGDSNEGNFGILALDGKGAKSYLETLKYGFDESLSLDETVLIQTGNIAGATREGVEYRMNQCPNPDGDITVRDCERILPVIVYKQGDSNSVIVTGFAFFYLVPPENEDSTEIKGKFIKRVDTGTYIEGSQNKGAYMSRLVE